MSGHSKWAGIKHKKAATDAKKSRIFGKMSGLIAIAARENPDPEANPKLKMAIDRAKSFNMPLNNIEKAIKRGSSKDEGENLEELLIEGYLPEGKAVLIKAITDNKNRTISEIKHLLSKNEGKMVEGGAVKWLFEEKGEIILEKEKLSEEEELKIIELGAENIDSKDGETIILTKPADLGETKNKTLELKINIKDVSLSFIPKNLEKIDEKVKEKYIKILDALDEHSDVSDIYYNFEI